MTEQNTPLQHLLRYTEEEIETVAGVVTKALTENIFQSARDQAGAITLAVLQHFNPKEENLEVSDAQDG